MSNRIHLCYGADQNMLEPLCVSAHSAAASVPGRDLSIWVFHPDLTPAAIEQLRRVLAPFPGAALHVQAIDLEVFADIKGLHGAVMPFVKLLLPQRMQHQAARIVVLDADTVVVGGLEALYDHNLNGRALGAVSYGPLKNTLEAEFFAAQGLDLQTASFNSGVMLVDVNRWNDNRTTEHLIETITAVDPRTVESDQPFLNLAFYDDFESLRIRYNKRAGPDTRIPPADAADGVLHFVGLPKPWDLGGRLFNVNYRVYEEYRRRAGVPHTPSLGLVPDERWERAAKGLWAGLRTALPLLASMTPCMLP
jgi:lipopolysaccharide biosynthesis glycosyltransferase